MKAKFTYSERGSLVVAIMFMIVAGVLGTTIITKIMWERSTVEQSRSSARALYSAEAGCVEAIARMADPESPDYIGPDIKKWDKTPGWGAYVRMQGDNSPIATVDPGFVDIGRDGLDNDGDKIKDEGGESYPVIVVPKVAGSDVKYAWARARFLLNPANEIMLFGDHDKDTYTAPIPNTSEGEPIILVTAKGYDGSSSRMIEMECVKFSETERYVVRNRREVYR